MQYMTGKTVEKDAAVKVARQRLSVLEMFPNDSENPH
jgi:hypothetical protein